MREAITIVIPGKPVSQQRHRDGRGKNQKSSMRYDPCEDYKKIMRSWIERNVPIPATPMQGAIRVDSLYLIPRPKGHFGTGRNCGRLRPSAPLFHSIKPDEDNMRKFVLDALKGLFWRDDAQIVCGFSAKAYCDDRRPKTVLRIREMHRDDLKFIYDFFEERIFENAEND